jgi:hypothetical protein
MPWTVTVDWGDESEIETIATGTMSFAGAHQYGRFGTYIVTAKVTDKDGGSSAPETIALRVEDPTPPEIAVTLGGTAGNAQWFTSDVNVTWTVRDPESGIASSTGCANSTVTQNTAGTTFTCSATNGSGLAAEKSVTVKRDANHPAVSPVVVGTLGSNGWYTSDVEVTWSVTNAGPSGASACPASSLTQDSPASSYSCTSTTGAGLTGSGATTIKRDATRPAIGYSGNVGTYTVDQTVGITCSAGDAMSGLASSTCATVGGAAYSFNLGANTFSATATDRAGNMNSASTTFTVMVTPASLCTLVERFSTSAGVANSMCTKIGQQSWNALQNELSAQSGKKISAANAGIIARLAEALAGR